MGDTITPEDLLASLERPGVITLLPGAYAAQSLRRAFDARQRRQRLGAWQAPRVLTWSEWTRGLWTQLVSGGAESRLLLNAAQEHSLWSELIGERSSDESSLATVDGLAGLARGAWTLAGAWQATHRLRACAMTHDTRTFAGWAEAFQRRCNEEAYLSPALLDSALLQHLEQGRLPLPAALQLVDFTGFTPAQSRLLATLRGPACRVDILSVRGEASENKNAGRRRLTRAPNGREELLLAVRWARAQVEEAGKRDKTAVSETRIGLLLPQKDLDRAELEGVFREVLAPELQPLGADLSSAPWEFAAGEPLASAAVVSTALDLLRLCFEPLQLPLLSGLLMSPYLGNSAQREANARFDALSLRGRSRLRPELGLRELALMIAPAQPRDEPAQSAALWLVPLDDLVERSLDPKLRRSFSEWMEVIRQLLRAAGWPGDRVLTADEAAAVQAWDDALDQVATLDFSGKRIAFSSALKAVERQVRAATLQLPRRGVSIIALRPEEAVGCPWNALVFLRGSEANWPSAVRLNPLLAASLQRELGMPGARPETEQLRLASVLAKARTSLATCAAETADGPLRPAPLFDQLGFTRVSAGALLPTLEPDAPVLQLAFPDDERLPALPSSEVRKGTRVLQLQGACGFAAFAELRLNAATLEVREPGLNARESGVFLHGALERFWRQVRSQDGLRALSAEERRSLLTECIEAAVPSGIRAENGWDLAYLALQKRRLLGLLEAWLRHELRRGPFTVAELEHAAVVPVGPLRLQVRVDRVDEVDGGLALIDYKSGAAADTKNWLGERPNEPQLPLYSLLRSPEEMQGIAYAHLRAGTKMGWHGLEAAAGILPPRNSAKPAGFNLREQLDNWRSTLTQLATDFSLGKTDVNPKDFTINCKRCAQRLLCRLDPATLHAGQLPDEAAESEEKAETEEAYG